MCQTLRLAMTSSHNCCYFCGAAVPLQIIYVSSKIATVSQTKTMYSSFFVLMLLLFGIQTQSHAQKDSTTNTDSLHIAKKTARRAKKEARHQKFLATLPANHNPKTATLLALIPGMGQIYNRRYWKLPIVYGGLGALGYLWASNHIDYRCYRKAYLQAVDSDPNTNYQCPLIAPNSIDNASLKILRDDARSNSETFLLLSVLFYGLTIGDAFVDAHLMSFDISDDLSLSIQPQMNYSVTHRQVVPALGLTFQVRPTCTPYFRVQF